MNIRRERKKERKGSYGQNGTDGLVNPAVFFEQLTDDYTQTKNSHEHCQRNHLSIVVPKVSYIIRNYHRELCNQTWRLKHAHGERESRFAFARETARWVFVENADT